MKSPVLNAGGAAATDTVRKLLMAVDHLQTRVPAGRLLSVSNVLVQAELPGAHIGEMIELRSSDTGERRYAEVIGLEGNKAILAPFGSTAGLSIKTEVIALRRSPEIMVGDHLLGHVVDAFGNFTPMAGGVAQASDPSIGVPRPINTAPPDPLSRPRIKKPLSVGIRVIDAAMTCGVGQRIGIYGNAGTGKSTLVSSIVANSSADVIVVGLIGERGREVGDFIAKVAESGQSNRCIVVAATSDRPPVERVQATLVATTLAEHFRDRGLNVLLVIDSVTRVARALRDLGLSANEPPTRRGFPPSVFSMLPRLFERAGTSPSGSITAFYTVLVEGEADMDPVAEETRALLDGHIVLSPKLAAKGQYPAIDILESRSRVMSAVTSPEHNDAASRLRELVAKYNEIELLVQVGEYRRGTDATADAAIARIEAIRAFLKQKPEQRVTLETTIGQLMQLVQPE
jgi:ATP synthase in type III secretion protein N